MTFKAHIPPTLHNAVGTLLAAAVIAVAGCVTAWLTRRTSIALPIWLLIAVFLTFAGAFALVVLNCRRRISRLATRPLSTTQDFLDDYQFVPRLGLYRHKTKPGYFCGSCTAKRIVAPLLETKEGWRCQIQGCEKWHSNPDYKRPLRPPENESW